MGFSIIAAIATHDGAIGVTRDGVPGLPWPRLRHDMAFFAWITRAKYPVQMATHFTMFPQTIDIAHSSHSDAFHVVDNNSVIMGKRTWESLERKPLAHRHNIVLSTTSVVQWKPPDTMFTSKLVYALDLARRLDAPHTFVIGGASVYAEALRHPACERLYLTEVAWEGRADTYWPESRIDWEQGIMDTWGETQYPATHWQRTACSAWITEPERPRYRFAIYERAQS